MVADNGGVPFTIRAQDKNMQTETCLKLNENKINEGKISKASKH